MPSRLTRSWQRRSAELAPELNHLLAGPQKRFAAVSHAIRAAVTGRPAAVAFRRAVDLLRLVVGNQVS